MILLITYAISWFILLCIYIASWFKRNSSGKEEWYIHVFIIALAPIVILSYIYGFIKDKLNATRNRRKEQIKRTATQNYLSATEHNFNDGLACTAHTLLRIAENQQHSMPLSCLRNLTLQSGWNLDVEICKESGLGDDSRLMATNGDVKDPNIWEYIEVKESPIAAWEVYLLHSLWHVLPHFWHGGYNRRSYIFSKEDVYKISFMISEDRDKLISIILNYIDDLTPEIAKYDKYYISCCYWSDWKGLIKELVEITIENNKVKSILNVDKKTLFKYDCGIRF